MLAVWYPTHLMQPTETPWTFIAVVAALTAGYFLGLALYPKRRPSWSKDLNLDKVDLGDARPDWGGRLKLEECPGNWSQN